MQLWGSCGSCGAPQGSKQGSRHATNGPTLFPWYRRIRIHTYYFRKNSLFFHFGFQCSASCIAMPSSTKKGIFFKHSRANSFVNWRVCLVLRCNLGFVHVIFTHETLTCLDAGFFVGTLDFRHVTNHNPQATCHSLIYCTSQK